MTPDQEETLLKAIATIAGTDEIREERDLDLHEAGLMDSMAFVELLVALDDDLGVVVPPTEVERTELATVNKIIAFVSSRL